MTTETDSKYPSWRDALFSEDTIANIRCAIKYTFWHASYALLTVGMVTLGSLLALGVIINEKIPSSRISSGLSRVASAIGSIVPSVSRSTKKRLARAGAVAGFVVLVGSYIVLAVTYPVVTIGVTIGAILWIATMIVLTIAWEYASDRISDSDRVDSLLSRFEGTGSKAKQIPGVRRVYGECPVHMDLEPKWFDDLMN